MDKFLSNSSFEINAVIDGSLDILGNTLSSVNLNANMAVKTDSENKLISSQLLIADVAGLQTALNNKLSNPILSYVEFINANTPPQPATNYGRLFVGMDNNLRYVNQNDTEFNLCSGSSPYLVNNTSGVGNNATIPIFNSSPYNITGSDIGITSSNKLTGLTSIDFINSSIDYTENRLYTKSDAPLVIFKNGVENFLITNPSTTNTYAIARFSDSSGSKIENTGITIDPYNNITGAASINTNTLILNNNYNSPIYLKAQDYTYNNYTMFLPQNMGSSNYVLTTDGYQNTSWQPQSGQQGPPGPTGPAGPPGRVNTNFYSGNINKIWTSISTTGDLLQDTNLYMKTNNSNFVISTDDVSGSLNSVSGVYNMGIGSLMPYLYGASYNIAIGLSNLNYMQYGGGNIAVGRSILSNNAYGVNNVILGDSAMSSNYTCNNSNVIGNGAGQNIYSLDNCVISGSYAVGNSSGTHTDSVYIGFEAGYNLNNSDSNVSVGAYSLYAHSSSIANTAIGYAALAGDSSTSSYNTAIGYNAASYITTGSSNTIIGSNVGYSLTTGNYNVLINASDVNTGNLTNNICMNSRAYGNSQVRFNNSSPDSTDNALYLDQNLPEQTGGYPLYYDPSTGRVGWHPAP